MPAASRSRRNGLLIALVLAAMTPAAVAAPVATPDGTSVLPATAASHEAQGWALAAANRWRAEHGQPPLVLDPALTTAAEKHAADMAWHGRLDHRGTDGGDLRARYLAAGGDPSRLVAENIAHCAACYNAATAAVIARLHADWMASPGHRANLLSPGLDRFGFGITIDDEFGLYAVESFAGPGTAPADAGAPMSSAAEQSRAALALINTIRRDHGAAALRSDDRLVQAAGDRLAAASAGSAAASSTVPPDETGRWRSLTTFAARCSGCGSEPTAGDIRGFVERWLADPGTRAGLLEPGAAALGLALRADGQGGKSTVLLLGTPR